MLTVVIKSLMVIVSMQSVIMLGVVAPIKTVFKLFFANAKKIDELSNFFY
jgi:hypothetical protein